MPWHMPMKILTTMLRFLGVDMSDWDDIMFKKGNHQTYEASISGGTDKFKYYSSISYLKQEGIAINSGLERISGRLNVDYQATDKLKLGANMLICYR